MKLIEVSCLWSPLGWGCFLVHGLTASLNVYDGHFNVMQLAAVTLCKHWTLGCFSIYDPTTSLKVSDR